eukprot:gene24970-31370_t
MSTASSEDVHPFQTLVEEMISPAQRVWNQPESPPMEEQQVEEFPRDLFICFSHRLNTNSSDVEDATQPFKPQPLSSEDRAGLTANSLAKNKINSFLEKTVKTLDPSVTGTANSSIANGPAQPQSAVDIWDTIQSTQ